MVEVRGDAEPRRLFTENSRWLPILVRPHVRRYWLTIGNPGPKLRGYTSHMSWPPAYMGVSAFDRGDALSMVTAFSLYFFTDQPVPVVSALEEDIDLSEERFDVFHRHGVFGTPIWRGIWYPRPWCGYIWSPVPPVWGNYST